MHRWDIINLFIKKKNYKSYLEIGYFKGWSFDNVNCETKVAVDPNPSKDEGQQEMKDNWILNFKAGFPNFDRTHQLWKTTSDRFFEQIKEENKFDIVFIDGLHEAGQVEKDIRNSLKHLSPKGTIILHDCNPPTLAHATTGDAGGNWNGDVYKAFIKFRLQYPEYLSYTIDTDWGCGIIETPPLKGTWVDMRTEDLVEGWEYFDKNRKSLLNLITVEEFKTRWE